MSVPDPIVGEFVSFVGWLARQGVQSLQSRAAAKKASPSVGYAQPPWEQVSPPQLPSPPWSESEVRARPWGASPNPMRAPDPPPSPGAPAQPVDRAASTVSPERGDGYDSYAADMEPVGVACRLCTNRHLRSMHGAAKELRSALERGDSEEARRQTLRLVGEAEIMARWDWTPDKLANTPPEDRAAVEAVMPEVAGVLAAVPAKPPTSLVVGWADVDEGLRFARSRKPSERDHHELSMRLEDAQDQISAMDEALAPHRVPEPLREHASYALDELRNARHAITGGGSLDAAEAALHEAAMAWTPVLTPEQADQLVALTGRARSTFQKAVMGRASAVAPQG